jgi:trehalose-6-phosphate synthase
MTPSTLLHPLKLDVVGFQEDEHDYHFRAGSRRLKGWGA